jgi:hypothetical protein
LKLAIEWEKQAQPKFTSMKKAVNVYSRFC